MKSTSCFYKYVNKKEPEAVPVSDKGAISVHAQFSPTMCMRGKFKCLKLQKETTMERNYVKETWHILIVSISSPRRKVQHSCTLSTYLIHNQNYRKMQKKKKKERKNRNEIWYIQNKFFIELGHIQFSRPRFDSFMTRNSGGTRRPTAIDRTSRCERDKPLDTVCPWFKESPPDMV